MYKYKNKSRLNIVCLYLLKLIIINSHQVNCRKYIAYISIQLFWYMQSYCKQQKGSFNSMHGYAAWNKHFMV